MSLIKEAPNDQIVAVSDDGESGLLYDSITESKNATLRGIHVAGHTLNGASKQIQK